MNQSWAITILRVVTGIIFLAHGWQKLFQLGFTERPGCSAPSEYRLPAGVVGDRDFRRILGGLSLVTGLLTRWAAALNGFDMIVAILLVHLKNGSLSSREASSIR